MTIEAAGYIVCDATAIWGAGETEAEAWQDAEAEFDKGGITILDDEPTDGPLANSGAWTLRRNLMCVKASARLMALVRENGGDVSHFIMDGVHCTENEYDNVWTDFRWIDKDGKQVDDLEVIGYNMADYFEFGGSILQDLTPEALERSYKGADCDGIGVKWFVHDLSSVARA